MSKAKKLFAASPPIQEAPLADAIGASLFGWNSDLSPEKKAEILNWFNTLDREKRGFVEALMWDARQEEATFAND